jgi:outer membrane protein assembly factor BamB
VLWKSGGKTSVALISKDGVVGVDPSTGSQLWKLDGGSVMPSCAVAGDKLLVPSSGMAAYDLTKPGQAPEELWTSGQLGSGTSTPVADAKRVFAVNGAGVLAMGNADDGKMVWKIRLNGRFSGSPVLAGKWLYILSEEGFLKVVDTTTEPEGTIASELKLGGTFLSTPAISDGDIYVRSDEALWKISK